jgi:hypothetical protein
MDGTEDRPHDDGCPGMWRLVEAVLDRDGGGAVALYRCELCEGLLRVGPGGVHPATV